MFGTVSITTEVVPQRKLWLNKTTYTRREIQLVITICSFLTRKQINILFYKQTPISMSAMLDKPLFHCEFPSFILDASYQIHILVMTTILEAFKAKFLLVLSESAEQKMSYWLHVSERLCILYRCLLLN